MLFGASKYDGQFGCLYEIVYLHLNNYFDFHVRLSIPFLFRFRVSVPPKTNFNSFKRITKCH